MPSNFNIPEPIPKLGERHSTTVVWRYNPEFFRLIGSICKKCERRHFPRRYVCYCGSRDLEDIQLSHQGKIKTLSWEHMHGGVRGFDDTAPRLFAVIELDDGPHVSGEITGIPLSVMKREISNPQGREFWNKYLGEKVRMVIRRLRKMDNGNLCYGYKFQVEV